MENKKSNRSIKSSISSMASPLQVPQFKSPMGRNAPERLTEKQVSNCILSGFCGVIAEDGKVIETRRYTLFKTGYLSLKIPRLGENGDTYRIEWGMVYIMDSRKGPYEFTIKILTTNNTSLEMLIPNQNELERCIKGFQKTKVFFDKARMEELYEYKKFLSKGGTGRITIWQDKKNAHQTVVIKEIRYKDSNGESIHIPCVNKEHQESLSMLEFAQNEVEISMQVSSLPECLTYYATYKDSACIYMCIEHFDASPLQDLKGKLKSIKDVESITNQLLHALEELELAQIVHRDINLNNVLVRLNEGETPIVKLIDFGLSINSRSKKSVLSKIHCGTPGYLPPEAFEPDSDSIDERSDIYQLGLVVFEMITGSSPFKSNSFDETLLMNRIGMIDFNHTQILKLPKEFTNLLIRILTKDHNYRPSAIDIASNNDPGVEPSIGRIRESNEIKLNN